ncbi:MAG: hypothetical protein VX675_04205 [Planctomycetota bacterium]|nr:hypothetical protein [Planctomycetota bacterium]
MQRPLQIICLVSILRVLAEFALGTWISLVALGWDGEGFLAHHPTASPEAGDREAFYILGVGLLLLGLIRLVQVVGVFAVGSWARVLGQWLGWVDFLTPLTLPLGLWALQVYRHPDTIQAFRPRQAASADQVSV